MNMKWYEICIHTTHEAQEPITQRLLDHGISGVMIKDPLDLVRKREAPFGDIYISLFICQRQKILSRN